MVTLAVLFLGRIRPSSPLARAACTLLTAGTLSACGGTVASMTNDAAADASLLDARVEPDAPLTDAFVRDAAASDAGTDATDATGIGDAPLSDAGYAHDAFDTSDASLFDAGGSLDATLRDASGATDGAGDGGAATVPVDASGLDAAPPQDGGTALGGDATFDGGSIADAQEEAATGCPAGSTPFALEWNPSYTGTDGTTIDPTRSGAPVKVQLPVWVPSDAPGTVGSYYSWTAPRGISADTTDPNIDSVHGGVMLTVDPSLPASEDVLITATHWIAGVAATCGSMSLTVTKYDAGLFELGSQRYWNGTGDDAGEELAVPDAAALLPFLLPSDAGPDALPTDAAIGSARTLAVAIGTRGQACANCHQATSNPSITKGVSATPEQTGGYNDEELLATYVEGTIRDGGAFIPVPGVSGPDNRYDAAILSYDEWSLFHRWHFESDDQARAVVVYLRSLTPQP